MLNRLFHYLLVSLACVAAAIVVYLVISVDLEIVLRSALNRPTGWVIDFTEYSLIYILFLASAWVLLIEGHVKVDILVNVLPPKVRRLLNITTSLVGAGACAAFFWFSLWLTWEAISGGEVLWKAMMIPKWTIWIVMPLGSLLLTIQFLRRAWLYIKAHNVPGEAA